MSSPPGCWLSARYVVGCDGANSLVRRAIGGGQEDRGFEADWLVIDAVLKPGHTIESLGIPAAAQYCNPARPTTIVPAGVRGGRVFRRWEFMRLAGEAPAELEKEDVVWDLLKPWAGPDEIEIVRHKIYNFRSLLAERWRDRRLLIAGDAAHVMPPFMGQGMCSGLRDAWNLAWKLGLILDEQVSDAVLDSYQTERETHVSRIIDASIFLGKIICILDPEEAASRDQRFLSGDVEPPPQLDALGDGLIHRDRDGARGAGAGVLSPHVMLARGAVGGRMDDLLGPGFTVLALDEPSARFFGETARRALDELGARFAAIGEGPGALVDLDGRLGPFMTGHGWRGMIVRPDFYVYGGVASVSELPRLAYDLRSDLGLRPSMRCSAGAARGAM